MKSIQSILEDLYLIDPSLKNHEQKLIIVIEELLRAKPETHFDASFARELKTKILLEKESKQPWWHALTLPRLAYAGGTFAVVLAIGALVSQRHSVSTVSFGGMTSERLAVGAFGQLPAMNGSSLGTESARSATFGQGGGNNGVAARPMMSSDAAVGKIAPSIIAPYYNYTFVYKGDTIVLEESKLDVFRRVKNTSGDTGLADALFGAPLKGIDLRSFAGSGLTSFELADQSENGYIVNVNLREGTVSINNNYYVKAVPACSPDGVCGQEKPMTLGDIPSDETVISLADAFLKAHGIETGNYSAPEVDNSWRTYINENNQYVPDTLTVRYPLTLNGRGVYDQGGGKNGLMVSVNVRENKVTGVWQIQSQNYQSSEYEAITDVAAVLKQAEAGGGTGGIYYMKGAENKTELELGTPERIYVLMWQYHDGVSDELYVPALRFPIMNAPQQVWQKNVVVPLIKEMMPQYGGVVTPVLYRDGGAASTGSAGSGVVVEPAKPLIK